MPDEEALLVVVGVDEPARDPVRPVASDRLAVLLFCFAAAVLFWPSPLLYWEGAVCGFIPVFIYAAWFATPAIVLFRRSTAMGSRTRFRFAGSGFGHQEARKPSSRRSLQAF